MEKFYLMLAVCFCASQVLLGKGFSVERTRILELAELTEPPERYEAEGFDVEDGLNPIYYEALHWKGNPTRVFAWLGIPHHSEGELPGVVLVHGGGGTAFKEWVKKWNAQGFAAISIAVEGQVDQREAGNSKIWKQHAWPGPKRDGIYADSSEPLTDQWMYHAVADTILANSLLRSLPEVDPEKVGLAGISWGGVITSTVIGVDNRFAFAIPIYGCGHLYDAQSHWGSALDDNLIYRNVWDPMQRMDRVQMPVLWLSWPGDNHFPLDCQAACYRAAPGPHMVSLIPGMKHSHPAGWNPPDSYAFAREVVNSGGPWCRQAIATLNDDQFEVLFIASKRLNSAALISTVDSGFTGKRKWLESPATLERTGTQWMVRTTVPSGSTGWFVNVRSGDLTASSDYWESSPE